MTTHAHPEGLRTSWKRLAQLAALLLACAFALGGWVVRADRGLREELLGQARLVAGAVNLDRIRNLTGTEADLDSPDYLRMKEQLAAARSANPQCRFLYLIGRRPDGPVFFFADSEPAGSADESPAGQIYDEIPEGYRRVFDTRRNAVEGPATDRWGTWVTALIPLSDPGTGELMAVLGMDMDAREWKWEVAAQAALPAGLLVMVLIILAGSRSILRRPGRAGGIARIGQSVGLREKTALALGSALVLLIAVLYLGARNIIQDGFAHLEGRDARKDVDRVLLALAEQRSTLESTVQDWAYWDDTYAFAQDRNAAFIEGNLTSEAMGTLRIRMLALVDGEGRLIWGGALDPEAPSGLVTGEDFNRRNGEAFFQSFSGDVAGAGSGIVVPGEDPLLVAFAPILNSQQQGPARGRVVMGRVLDQAEAERLAATLKMNLALFRADGPGDDPERAGLVQDLAGGAAHAVRILDEHTLAAYGLVTDLGGRPALLVKVGMTRDIHREAVRTTAIFAALLAMAGVVIILSILVLMRKLVLEKLERLSGSIHRVARTEDFSKPIAWEGTDELAGVARDVNQLLEAVTQSRRNLVASEEQLAATLRSIGDGVIACDRAGRVTSLNQVAETLTGWSSAAAAGRPMKEVFRILDARSREPVVLPVGRALHEGVSVELANHTVLIARDGAEHQIADSCAPIRDAAGAVIGAVLVFRDVTQEYRQREALRESEAFQRELLLNLPAGVVIVDPETRRIERVNEHAAALFGAPAEVLIGKRCHQFLCPTEEDACPVCDLGRTVDNSERIMLRHDGSTLPILKTVKRVRLGGQEKLLECFVDISDRKQSEERLRFQSQVLDSVSEAIVATDLDETILYWGRGAEMLYGYSAAEVLGRSYRDFAGSLEKEDAAGFRRQILEQGSWTGEHHQRRRDGSSFWTSVFVSVLRDAAGRPIGFIGLDHDITERKRAEQQLQETNRRLEEATARAWMLAEQAESANRAKSEFLANLSHEIRTPMNGVLGMIGLLRDTKLDLTQRRFAETAMNSAESLLALLNDILDFSKMEAGKLALDHSAFEVRKLLDDVAAPLAVRAQEKGVELICAAAPDIPEWLCGDPIRLRQILVNLVGNAVKFTDQGEVALTVEPAPSTAAAGRGEAGADGIRLRFAVRDTGIGIPADKQGLLFQKFSQVDASTTRRFGGTGLGLAIARQLTELMGGEIGLESEEGRGTTFWFSVCFERSRKPASPGEETKGEDPASFPSLQGARILIVDDNETNRQVLSAQLQAWGFQVEEAQDGPSALRILQRERTAPAVFAAAILDMQMPGMDGMALAEVIRNESAYDDLKLILLTSIGHANESRRYKKAGFCAWLSKPVRASDLFDMLHTALAGGARPPAAEPAADSAGTVHSRTARILLVEDNGVNRMVAEGILKKLGWRTDAVGNGVEALAALAREKYDLALMDVQMPGMDGLEATRRIRAGETSSAASPGGTPADVPIIAMTAHAMPGDREECIEAGMDDYLAKPISPAALAGVLAKWLGDGKTPRAKGRKQSHADPDRR